MADRAAGDRYAVSLDLRGRRVLVVGGGEVATRRATDLANSGALVHVVTPWASDDMWALADCGRIRMTLREFEDGDHSGAWLVHSCTGQPEIDGLVARACEASRIWCIRADNASASPAWTSAVAREDGISVAINADADPRRATTIRDAIAQMLRDGALPLHRARTPRDGTGWVALVGGGPGDPALITVRGKALLSRADVVVVDRLAPRALIDELPAHVEIIEAGKGPDAHTMTQDEINAVIVERAAAGHRVVRLKGGDPFVLGRGGEEVAACAAAGVPVEVVPGITSAIAVPGAAGIPVTHRGVSSQFSVISAHDDIDAVIERAPSTGTLVLLMGVGRLEAIVDRLVAQGRPATTPIAVIERGTLPEQRVTLGTLTTIAQQCADAYVESPAVIVIGEVADLANEFGPTIERVEP